MKLENIFSDLWLAAFWGPLVVGLILFFLNMLFSRNKNSNQEVTFKHVREVVVKHVVEINGINSSEPEHNPRPSRSASNNNEDPTPVIFGGGLLLLSIFYAKYQTEVIAVEIGFTTFILTFVLFTVLFSLRNNISHDPNWKAYLYTTFLLGFMGYPLMYLALNPIYAPIEVRNMSSVIADGGLKNIVNLYGLKGMGFILLQTLGFVTLAFAMLLQVLSLVFYTAAIQLAISDVPRPIVSFIARATYRFKSPYLIMSFSLIFYLLSFFLISGVGFEWWYSAVNNETRDLVEPPLRNV